MMRAGAGIIVWTALTTLALAGCPGRERPQTDGGPQQDAGGVCGPETPYDRPVPTQRPERDDGEPTELACALEAEVWPQSMPVTMFGCLDIFGLGERVTSQTLRIAVYDVTQDPTTEQPAYGQANIETTTPEAVECEKGAYYEVDDVPTSTPLLVKVWDSQRNDSMIVVDSYQFGVLLDPSQIEFGSRVEFEANVINSATYTALPILAGLTIEGFDNITDGVGRAAIAGELQDCDEKVLQNVMIGGPCIDERAKVIYTIGEECDQPDRSLTSTGECGTYGILNVAPGWHLIEAVYSDGSQTQTLGRAEVYVFPDSVTIFTAKGLTPVVGQVDAGLPDATAPDTVVPDGAEPDAGSPDTAAPEDSAVEDVDISTDSAAEDGAVEDAQ